MNVFGTPEYSLLKDRNLEEERVVPKPVLASESEIQENYLFVLADETSIESTEVRRADDESFLAPECESKGNPYSYCLGKRYAKKPSAQKPACVDNNSSLNAQSGCYDEFGFYHPTCMQVGYTQNAFISLCGSEYEDNDHCGVFLEIHIGTGTPYDDEETIISETKLTQPHVSGYYTTIMNTTYKGVANRTLCSYSEDFMRVGSTVYVEKNAPTCCCPPVYKAVSQTGSFLCPIGSGGVGPYGTWLNTTAAKLQNDVDVQSYPFCVNGVDDPDE
jgi:hypothetical protein